MFSFLATLFFMLLLGKKVLVPYVSTLGLAVLLVIFHFAIDIDTIPVLITLFVTAPLLIRFRYSALTHSAFVICVLLPSLCAYSLLP
ncbi:hypothetical protein [Vibrio ziniensis]|uniref:Uncharacterized protein n=1 Tax=Vibrio ziniensis TaxID=2711221 RepID=A0A6G7CNA1_9VIBR|nr:hypothetical protein [Vibrio ziniensis]QIH43528.1 hypothetical protein G5S32_16155 [Vibrio ziniensis]